MSDNGTKVILTNKLVSKIGKLKPAQIDLGTLSPTQIEKLLKFINEYDPKDFSATKCFCNLHFDTTTIHASGIRTAQQFAPIRPMNKPNEMIVEIIPAADKEDRDCGLKEDANCALCFQRNLCKSPFITRIRELLPMNAIEH